MPASWPANLTYSVSQQAYAVQALGQAPLASPMQSGKIRQRPQYTLRISRVAYGWEFKAAELGVFRNFIASTLGEGAAEFTLPLWIESAQAYQTRTVMIREGAGGISERKLGFDRTLVSCVLDVRNL
ncbi:Phage tail protein [Methylorubrum aminovorans]